MCGLREVVSKTINIAKFKYVELSLLSIDLIISFQPHSNSTRCVCVCVVHVSKKGVQLCPLLPIRRLLPKLSLANLEYNYINASVAGQCGQAARDSDFTSQPLCSW